MQLAPESIALSKRNRLFFLFCPAIRKCITTTRMQRVYPALGDIGCVQFTCLQRDMRIAAERAGIRVQRVKKSITGCFAGLVGIEELPSGIYSLDCFRYRRQ